MKLLLKIILSLVISLIVLVAVVVVIAYFVFDKIATKAIESLDLQPQVQEQIMVCYREAKKPLVLIKSAWQYKVGLDQVKQGGQREITDFEKALEPCVVQVLTQSMLQSALGDFDLFGSKE